MPTAQEYLKTTYEAQMEFRDGQVVDRHVGELEHSDMQVALASYICEREKEWDVEAYIALTVRVRENWYALPDVCFYAGGPCEGPYPSRPPLLWIEILSTEESREEMGRKAAELVANGVPYVWVIDPVTLESDLWTAAGVQSIGDKILRIPNTPIVIPLLEVMED